MTADLRAVLESALADRYALERELGRGGMATVFLAQDLRFAARLQHPHILTVLDSGEAAGQLWFTMPFVDGESLRDRLRRERQLAP